MADYQYKVLERETGGPCWGRPELSFSFDAPNEDTARFAAHRRAAELPPGCFAVLYDHAGRQLWTGEAPEYEAQAIYDD